MGMKMVLGDVGGANADLVSYCVFSVGYNFVSSYCISSALGGLLFGSLKMGIGSDDLALRGWRQLTHDGFDFDMIPCSGHL
jgi:hypothetical protein